MAEVPVSEAREPFTHRCTYRRRPERRHDGEVAHSRGRIIGALPLHAVLAGPCRLIASVNIVRASTRKGEESGPAVVFGEGTCRAGNLGDSTQGENVDVDASAAREDLIADAGEGGERCFAGPGVVELIDKRARGAL